MTLYLHGCHIVYQGLSSNGKKSESQINALKEVKKCYSITGTESVLLFPPYILSNMTAKCHVNEESGPHWVRNPKNRLAFTVVRMKLVKSAH